MNAMISASEIEYLLASSDNFYKCIGRLKFNPVHTISEYVNVTDPGACIDHTATIAVQVDGIIPRAKLDFVVAVQARDRVVLAN